MGIERDSKTLTFNPGQGESSATRNIKQMQVTAPKAIGGGAKGKPDAENTVATPSPAYDAMSQHWEPVEDLLGGLPALIAKRDAYLPLEPFEDSGTESGSYDRRVGHLSLDPWYVRLRNGLVGTVLRKPIQIEATPNLESHFKNIDLEGSDLDKFADDLFKCSIDHGYSAIFVDHPSVGEGQVSNLAEERGLGLRPYWLVVKATEIIGIRSQLFSVRNMDGTPTGDFRRVPTQLRLLRTRTIPDGEFGEIEQEFVRVYSLASVEGLSMVSFRTFVQDSDGDWIENLEESGFMQSPIIPIFPVYSRQQGFFQGMPMMGELAIANIRHCQLNVDQDHQLHLTAMPKLVLHGYTEPTIEMSPDEAIVFSRNDGRAEWIGAPVEGAEARRVRIQDLETNMARLAIAPLIAEKAGVESAKAKGIERAQGNSMAAKAALSLQRALNRAGEFHAALVGEEKPELAIDRDFDALVLTPQQISAYSQLEASGQISLETLWSLLKRGEILTDDFDPEAEKAALQAELDRQAKPIVPDPLEQETVEDSE